MISATPALSSAPSSVVPSLVTMSWPTRRASSGTWSGSMTSFSSPGSTIRAAGVTLVNDRGDAGARRLGGGVDMGDEPDHRRVRGARERREHVAVLRQLDVVEADLAKLVGEQPREIELLGGARVGRGALLRLRVDADVAEEALEHVGCQLLGER